MVEQTGCGYPDRVRDGLHPVQYFCLANVYLKALRFDMATICLEKLKNSTPTDEASKFANRLERSYMPKHPVPDKAVERLREIAIWGGDENSKRRKEFQKIIAEYPGFECPYFFIQADWNNGNPDRRMEIQAMESVLSINPDNVDALARLMELYSKEPEIRRKYALRVSELDPDRIVDFDRIERTLLTKRRSEEKIQQFPEPVKKQTNEKADGMVAPLRAKKKYYSHYDLDYRFIDTNGQTVFRVGPNVKVADRFSDGLLVVAAPVARGRHSSDVQYWSNTGELAFNVDYAQGLDASEGLCAIEKTAGGGTRWSFFNYKGEKVIPSQYAAAKPFKEGLAGVELLTSKAFHMPKWGFVDRQGVFQVEPIYDDVMSFSEGLAAVSLNGRVGFIDTNGKLVIPARYDFARRFSNGLADVLVWDASTGIVHDYYIDRTGRVSFEQKHDMSRYDSFSMLSSVFEEFLKVGKNYSPFSKMTHRSESDFSDHLVLARGDNGKVGFKNSEGQFVIEPTFDSVSAFSEKLARVKIDDKYGYIDTTGNIIIPAQFAEAKIFTDGRAAVSKNGETWGFIDRNGQMVIPDNYVEVHPFAEGLAKVGAVR